MSPGPSRLAAGVPDRMPVVRGRVLGRPARGTWALLLAGAVLGAGVWALAGQHPGRAVGSYLGALVLVVVCVSTATMTIRTASRISPGTTFVAAFLGYVMTIAVLSFAWLVASPRVVDGGAVLTGAVVAVVVWTTGVARASWVR